MLKTIIKLSDGTEISSGTSTGVGVKSSKLTECVNSGSELTIGSVCANAVEITLFTPNGDLDVAAGDEITVYKQENSQDPVKVGVFILEKPTRPSANIMKLTGYDRVTKLDKDISDFLNKLTGQYSLLAFAGHVCKKCGLKLVTTTVPNADFYIDANALSFSVAVTGRQVISWIGELCARFCRANANGDIEFAWYTHSGKTITASGDLYYFQNGLTYETYATEKIGAVQLRLADSENGALWPEVAESVNSYIITGNAILNSRITEALLPYLQVIQQELSTVSYTPCKVSVPANMGIRAGNTVNIIDKNGVRITAYVMKKVQSGQKDTLTCSGSLRRDSTTATNNQSAAQKNATSQAYANAAAKNAVDAQTQEDIFNKLTNYGELQGLYYQNGKWYINAEFVQIINLVASSIISGILKSKDGSTYFDLDNGTIVSNHTNGKVEVSKGEVRCLDASGKTVCGFSRNETTGTYSIGLMDAFSIVATSSGPMILAPNENGGLFDFRSVCWIRSSDGNCYLGSKG